jgi:hypothetical protein
MIKDQNIKILLVLILFVSGMYYINFAISNGYIKSSIHDNIINADAVIDPSIYGEGNSGK